MKKIITLLAAAFCAITAQAGEFPDISIAEVKAAVESKKATIIDFFFVGCGPCRAQAPQLQQLYSRLREQGLQVVAIDLGDSAEAVKGFAEKFSLAHPVLVGGQSTDDEANVFKRYHVKAFPTTYLIDPNGKIVWQSIGYEGEGVPKLKKELEKLGLHP